jgi:hypothetical protein
MPVEIADSVERHSDSDFGFLPYSIDACMNNGTNRNPAVDLQTPIVFLVRGLRTERPRSPKSQGTIVWVGWAVALGWREANGPEPNE